MNHPLRTYTNFAAVAFGLLAAGIAIVLVPKLTGPRNAVANLDRGLIQGVWFVPAENTIDEVIWLDPDSVQSLYDLFSSESVEENPAKWPFVGTVGFTCQNGRNASVKLYDTGTQCGAFQCGDSWFRYTGALPEVIKNAR